MVAKNLTLFFLSSLMLSLFFRELPYINLFLAGRLWLFYGFLLLFLFFVWKRNYFSRFTLILLALVFLMGSFVLILFSFPDFAEILGLGIYFFLWLTLVWRMLDILKARGD